MLEQFFIDKVKERFQFSPTPEQLLALNKISQFLFSKNQDSLFLLTGYAGTGKSSLVGALVKTMTEFEQKSVLLAPTGRAAKVFSGYAKHPAYTIHKKIYRQKSYSNESWGFSTMDNLHKDTLFIVDEASMISNDGLDSTIFGSGRLLDDLIHYVYVGENCRLMLIGDTAQLPPVGQEYSPALQTEILSGYGLDVDQASLTETVRQAFDSGILYNATQIRKALNDGKTDAFPKLSINGFNDIKIITGDELIDTISSAYDVDGIGETMIVLRSNKRCNLYNEGIRNRILYREEELTAGDMLMITKNNYFWTENVENVDFLANGELIEVLRVKRTQHIYGFNFCDLLIKHPDYDLEMEIKIILDSLHSDSIGLTKEANEILFHNVLEDYGHIKTKAGKMQKIKTDPFYNAVQVKYGYATTCHKAQGGEWKNVFLDLGYIAHEHLGSNFYRWLYTAITRSSNKLYLVNLPNDFF